MDQQTDTCMHIMHYSRNLRPIPMCCRQTVASKGQSQQQSFPDKHRLSSSQPVSRLPLSPKAAADQTGHLCLNRLLTWPNKLPGPTSPQCHSRHLVMQVALYTDATGAANSDEAQRVGRLSFVDLAGSERANRTGNVGVRLK